MKIYLVSRNDGVGYDEYDSAVVVASSPEQAIIILKTAHYGDYSGWGSFDVSVEEILTEEKGIILKSFNAG